MGKEDLIKRNINIFLKYKLEKIFNKYVYNNKWLVTNYFIEGIRFLYYFKVILICFIR